MRDFTIKTNEKGLNDVFVWSSYSCEHIFLNSFPSRSEAELYVMIRKLEDRIEILEERE